MQELAQIIPDAQVLLAMEPEELGAKILFLLRKRSDQPVLFSNLIGELWPQNYPYLPNRGAPYPREKEGEINLALAEAWAWLTAQALLVPAPGQHGGPDWRILSRRARRFEDETEFANMQLLGCCQENRYTHELPIRCGPLLCAASLMWQFSRQ